jgi:transcriptional regulator with XRE-family HTH domain
MDNGQVGNVIRSLRLEKKITQLQLAEQIGVTDKAVSKWERGLGSPDISLFSCISKTLGANIENLLTGDLRPNDIDRGNMKRIKFYVCPICANVMFSTGEADTSCCGRKLTALTVEKDKENHIMSVEKIEDDYFITISTVSKFV